jgi:hypothetical protein
MYIHVCMQKVVCVLHCMLLKTLTIDSIYVLGFFVMIVNNLTRSARGMGCIVDQGENYNGFGYKYIYAYIYVYLS